MDIYVFEPNRIWTIVRNISLKFDFSTDCLHPVLYLDDIYTFFISNVFRFLILLNYGILKTTAVAVTKQLISLSSLLGLGRRRLSL